MSLTDMKIKKAKGKPKPYKLSDGGGLFLLVKPGGSKLWQQKYRINGKEKLLSHGPYPEISLKQAREKRDEARELIAEDRDPAVQKKLDEIAKETQKRSTFRLLAEEYLEHMEERNLAQSTMTKKKWYLLTLAEPIHNRPVAEITPAECLHMLKRIERRGRRESAKKLCGEVSAVFRYAVSTLRAETDPTWAIRDALLPPQVKNRAAILDEKEFGKLLREIENFQGYQITKDAMMFQIYTMTRPGEVRGAAKQEFDLEKDAWTVPIERMKMRREHVVPLSRQAKALVELNWPNVDGVELIFPSLVSNRRRLSENTFNSALRRMGYGKEEVTAHGFRSTASTILNERGFDPEVIEAALAHVDKNSVRRIYNRTTYWDRRAVLMQEWADLVDEFRRSAN